MKPTCALILNPNSGATGPDVRRLMQLFQQYEKKSLFNITTDEDSLRSIVEQSLSDGCEEIYLWGGDGSINHALPPLVGHSCQLGILPGGSANILTRELEIPLDPYTALEGYLSEKRKEKRVDVGESDGRYFVMRAEVGLHAQVILETDSELKDKWGWFAYWVEGVSRYSEPETFKTRIMIDGVSKEYDDMVTCFISNARSLNFAGRALDDVSQLQQGCMWLIVVRHSDVATFASRAIALKEALGDPDSLECHKVEQLSIETDEPCPVIVDGEAYGGTPFTMKVHQQALRLMTL